MYVCNCNGVREKTVDEAIRNGADTFAKVHKHCGTKPQCGGCLSEIELKIKLAKHNNASEQNNSRSIRKKQDQKPIANHPN